MAENSPIEWTDHTFNPWWGCTKVSPGCKHCYAETWANRYGHNVWGPTRSRRFFSESHWRQPHKWHQDALATGERARVFCASMADVFEDHPDIAAERDRLWSLITETPMLDWLLLTKRPENMRKFAPWDGAWPSQVWAMTSVENQEMADKRLPLLLDVPAVVRGLSVEPLIGPVDLRPWLAEVQWVIVGGESGPKSRPMHPSWVRDLRDQCLAADVPFFFKQWGNWIPVPTAVGGETLVRVIPGETHPHDQLMKRQSKKAAGRTLDGRVWNELPLKHEQWSLTGD
jgi:protein gp37